MAFVLLFVVALYPLGFSLFFLLHKWFSTFAEMHTEGEVSMGVSTQLLSACFPQA